MRASSLGSFGPAVAAGNGTPNRPAASRRRRLAVLFSPRDLLSPSSFSSLDHLAKVVANKGLESTLIGEHALDQLAEFDALFIRMTTSVGGAAYQFALRARQLGIPVIDDPVSIVRGSNKVLQHRLLASRRVALPRTAIVSSVPAIRDAVAGLGLPLVLKIPDGCFCRGVERAETVSRCEEIAARLLASRNSLLAQEYLPTSFDWRIGTLDGKPLFSCKYHMVPGHWQIVARGQRGALVNGPVEPVALERVPDEVLDAALHAARCIGDGFYGVDLKETPAGPVVIEVNDNPDLDCDAETAANPDAWDRLAEWFASAAAAAGHGARAEPCLVASS
jgi:glutathione synthase/RimK-type ligase-like ATP-grasp enzyme